MSRFRLAFPLVLLFYGLYTNAQDLSKYEKGTYTSGKDTILYRVLYPENFDQSKKYPILFFLHGRGESGSDNQKQLTHGAKLFLRDGIRKDFPAIIVFPQCPSDSYWANVEIKPDATGSASLLL